MDNLRKNERNLQYFRQQRENIKKDNIVNNNNSNNEQPNFFRNTRDFDANYYERGRNWQKNGLPLSSANDTFRRNMSFIKGYDKERQLNRIAKKEGK